MKKIIFDLSATQPYGTTKIHGGGKYGVVVCKKLIEIAPAKIAVYYNQDAYLDESICQIIKLRHVESHFSQVGSIVEIAKKYNYIIYTPLFVNDYLTQDCPTIIATIHGLRNMEMPADNYERFYKNKHGVIATILLALRLNNLYLRFKAQKMLQGCRLYEQWFSDKRCHFVVVSEHTKASLMSFVPSINTENLNVFYSPSTIDKHIELLPSKFRGQKFWLMVSGNRWLKNCLRAIEAFDSIFTQRPEIEGKVVITGIDKINFRHFKIYNKDRFIPLGYVSESELKSLYHDAFLFVYPSLNEGFGYPPLEAMYEGTPIIASAISSIPEVCGDSVLYFNPTLVSEIKMRILQMEDDNVRKEYTARGKQRQVEIEERQNKDLVALCNYILGFTEK